MKCPACGVTLVEVDNPMRPEFRHPRGRECSSGNGTAVVEIIGKPHKIPQRCEVCNSVIKVMCFLNTGVCCELCNKERARRDSGKV